MLLGKCAPILTLDVQQTASFLAANPGVNFTPNRDMCIVL